MSVQYPYRAVICGEEHIVKGWRGRKLVTNKGCFSVRHIYGDSQIQSVRLFEIVLIQSDGQSGWLINGKPLSLLESLTAGERFADIPRDENLRVHKDKICAVAWFDKTGGHDPLELLDLVLKSWHEASLRVTESEEPNFADVLRAMNHASKFHRIFAGYASPVDSRKCIFFN